MTPAYNSAYQSQLPITAEDLPTESTTTITTTTTAIYQDHLRLQSRELWEVSFQELLILYKNTIPPQPFLHHFIVNKDNIIVLKP
jgi:hypothetical protein